MNRANDEYIMYHTLLYLFNSLDHPVCVMLVIYRTVLALQSALLVFQCTSLAFPNCARVELNFAKPSLSSNDGKDEIWKDEVAISTQSRFHTSLLLM